MPASRFEFGTLLSYGADQRLIARRSAYYVDRILKGEKSAAMPVNSWPVSNSAST